MEASVREPNIKNFVRLLQCAARYGDDLCMHARKECWEISVTNSSKSAFCLFTLQPTFFSRYKPLGTADQQRRGVKCQLYVKSVLGVLGKASSVNAVERVDLRIVDPEGGLRARQNEDDDDEDDDIRVRERSAQLELKLMYHHGITKKHFLHLQSSPFLRVDVHQDSTPSGFQISAKALRDWLDHFSLAFGSSSSANGSVRGDSQLAWRFATGEVRVKNFDNTSTSTLATEIKIDPEEFEAYEVYGDDGRVDLALPMREFKATLQLAEQFNMDLDFSFSEATQPLTMSSTFIGGDRYGNEVELFHIFCAIATTSSDAFEKVSPSAPVQRTNGAPNGTDASRRKRESTTRSETADTPRKRLGPAGSMRGARSRASLSLTAAPPSRGPSQVSVVGGTFANETEPLFLPGASQGSQRAPPMTQEEALELAGMEGLDLEAMMDDAADDEGADDGVDVKPSPQAPDADDGVPADWDEVEFENMPANLMSTQRSAVAPVGGPSQRVRARSLSRTQRDPEDNTGDTPPPASPVRKSSRPTSRRQSVSGSASPERPDRASVSGKPSLNETRIFEPDPDLLGASGIFGFTSTHPRRRSTSAPVDDEDELDADEPDPTQAGRKFSSLFED